MVVALLAFLEAPLEPHRVEVRGVGRDLGAEQIERHRVVEVDVPLQGREVDAAEPADVVGLGLAHQLAGALHHASDPRLADEEMMRLFGQHEAARPRQRIETALGKARESLLDCAVGAISNHQYRDPTRLLRVKYVMVASIYPHPSTALL